MAKSQETWNKKEAEKNRQKKKKDKEQKKMERRSSPKGGSSLDDMIAYVDENGRITSTPPDPKNKKVIKEEDIVISVPKKAHVDPASSIRKGTVSFFNESKGYGFIKDHETQDSIFVHANGLVDQIKENSKVSYEVEMGKKGPNAVNVKLIP
jgi:cold shock CspA family protein